jgi:hypothetical protein
MDRGWFVALAERSLKRVFESPVVAQDEGGDYLLEDGGTTAYDTRVHGSQSPLADPRAS